MIYKASWPGPDLPYAWLYSLDHAHLPPFERPTHYLPLSKRLKEEMFLGKYRIVYFEGTVLPGGLYQIKEFVRQDEWMEDRE